MFTIEKGVPMNSPRSGKLAAAKSAIAAMDIGDSFVYPANAIPSQFYGYASSIGRKVRVLKEEDGKWRVFRAK